MKEFTSIEELAMSKTREEIVKWASEMAKCPYDYGGSAVDESECKNGDDAEQCNQCWLTALKDVKCVGDEEVKPRKSKKKATEEVKSELSAKDSNKGVLALKQLCKTMKRDEFPFDQQCPAMYGFPDTMNGCDGKHTITSQCKDCWKVILDGVEFATEEIDNTELIAPTNDLKMLNYVDKLVEEIKKLKASQDEWDGMLKLKIEEATAKVNEEKEKLQHAIDFNMGQLKTIFPQLQVKDTKTQQSVKTISGQVVLKKATQKIECDKIKMLDFAKEHNLNAYIKTKEEFNWGDYKKTLSISGNSIVDTTTGETISNDALSIVDVEEKMEVK